MTDISSLPRWQRFDEVQRKKAQKHLVYSAGTAGLAAAGMGAARWGAENAGGVLRRRGRVPAPVLGRVARAVRGPRFGRVMGGTTAAAGLLGAGSTLTWGASLGREIKRDEAKLRAQNLSKAVGLVDVSKREWNVGRRSSKGSIGVFTDDQYNKISDSAVALDRQRHGRRVKSNAMFYGGLGAAAGGAIGSKSRRVGRGALIGAVGGAGFGAGMGALSNAMRPARIRTQMQRPKMRRQVETQAYMNRVLAQQQQKVGKADDWRAHVSPGALEGYRYLKRGERDKKQLAVSPFTGAVAGTAGTAGMTALVRSGIKESNARAVAEGGKPMGYFRTLGHFARPGNGVPFKYRAKSLGLLAGLGAPTALGVGYTGLQAARMPGARRQWQEANRWRDKANKIKARGEQRMAVGKAWDPLRWGAVRQAGRALKDSKAHQRVVTNLALDDASRAGWESRYVAAQKRRYGQMGSAKMSEIRDGERGAMLQADIAGRNADKARDARQQTELLYRLRRDARRSAAVRTGAAGGGLVLAGGGAEAYRRNRVNKGYRSWIERKRRKQKKANAAWERNYVAETGDAPVGKAMPGLRVKPLIMRGSPVRRGTFVRKPAGQVTYRRGSL